MPKPGHAGFFYCRRNVSGRQAADALSAVLSRLDYSLVKEHPMIRALPLALVALALLAFAASPALAADTHEGLVVSAGNGELHMTDKGGKNAHTHKVDEKAKILRNGKDADLDDLEKGDHITVTTKTVDGKTVVTKIEAKSKVS